MHMPSPLLFQTKGGKLYHRLRCGPVEGFLVVVQWSVSALIHIFYN